MRDSFKHITAIVGAGAVLDFDYDYPDAVVPSTQNITNAIKGMEVKGYNKPKSDVISTIYHLAYTALFSTYQYPKLHNDFDLNFEELYFLIESMLSFSNKGTVHYSPYSQSPLFVLLNQKEELLSYYDIEYIRALHAIVGKIVDIINKYDCHFHDNPESELWYRSFWRGNEDVKYDIFTFNYDTTIEQSLKDYEDGYEVITDNIDGLSAFNPNKLLNNQNHLSTIQHLHGCIYYSACCPEECVATYDCKDFFKTKRVNDSLKYFGLNNIEQNQAREYFINSPILIGLRKLDKMTYLPSSIYHAELVNKLMQNDGLLIVGYSFNDLYVNQLLQRRILMRGDNHRMVIIDYIFQNIMSAQDLYNCLQEKRGKMLQFLRPFFNFRYEDFSLRGVHFTSKDAPIYNEDRKCMLFICGFKKTIELHSDLILSFL